MQSLLRRTAAFLTPTSSSTDLSSSSAQKTPTNAPFIFPTVSPTHDGPDCLHDCSTCTVAYPSKWSIDESDGLYGNVKGWSTHLLISTGKSDWVRDIADEKGSVMQAVGKYMGRKKKEGRLGNGRCMVSASDAPVPEYDREQRGNEKGETEVVVLPKWEVVEKVAPSRVAEFMDGYVAKASTTQSPFFSQEDDLQRRRAGTEASHPQNSSSDSATSIPTPRTTPPPPPTSPPSSRPSTLPPTPPSHPISFSTRPLPHRAVILLCSQKTRDARCGQSAPLLRREFERHLRPLGLYRDVHDARPGGVGIYFISHVGGHKWAANVMVYRRGSARVGDLVGEGVDEEEGVKEEDEGSVGETNTNARPKGQFEEAMSREAMQGIWLARVRPEDCEGIIKYTVLQGKVVKPERQLRGGFDRARGLTSW